MTFLQLPDCWHCRLQHHAWLAWDVLAAPSPAPRGLIQATLNRKRIRPPDQVGKVSVPHPCPPSWKCTARVCTLTLLGGLEAVMEVNPLNVISQGCVGQQSPVPVDDVGRKSKGMLLGVHDLGVGAVRILKDSSCERWQSRVWEGAVGLQQGCSVQVIWVRSSHPTAQEDPG